MQRLDLVMLWIVGNRSLNKKLRFLCCILLTDISTPLSFIFPTLKKKINILKTSTKRILNKPRTWSCKYEARLYV